MVGHPSNWLSIMGSNLWSPCPKCVTGENLIAATLEICVFSYCDEFLLPSPPSDVLMIDAQLFFFLNRLRLELQLRHAKVTTVSWHEGVFRVFLRILIMTSIVTKGAPVQSCRALTNHNLHRRWLTDNFHWPCTTSLSITQRANSCSNGRQWKQLQKEAMEIFCLWV